MIEQVVVFSVCMCEWTDGGWGDKVQWEEELVLPPSPPPCMKP